MSGPGARQAVRQAPVMGGPAPVRTVRSRLVLLLPAFVGVVVLLIPLAALLVRADWPHLWRDWTTPGVLPAVRLSLTTTTTTTVVCLLLGTPLAWFLARSEHLATRWLRALVTVPLVLPPVVGGVALLMAYGRRGVVAMPLSSFWGWLAELAGGSGTTLGSALLSFASYTVPFTTPAVVLAEVFVSMPFYVLALEGAMRGADPRADAIAATLGASPWRTFTAVVLPSVASGIASAAALAWARALGEFGATITFAGSFPGTTRTAPLAIYAALDQNTDSAISLSLLMLAISVLVLGLLRGRWLGSAR